MRRETVGANWNVIGLTDQGRSLIERHVYRPYSELTIHQKTSFGDRDGNGDVHSTDKGTASTICTATARVRAVTTKNGVGHRSYGSGEVWRRLVRSFLLRA